MGQPREILQTAAGLAGLLTGAVGLVYVGGAVVYMSVLSTAGLPASMNVATSLPREFLIGTGLFYVGLPLTIAALFLYLTYPLAKAPFSSWSVNGVLGLLSLIVTAGLAYGVKPDGLRPWIGVLVIGLTTIPLVFGVLRMLATEPPGNWGRNLALLAFATVTLVGILGVMVGRAATDLPPAVLCADDGTVFVGSFIGQTADSYYVGEESAGELPRLLSVPRSQVSRVFIGSRRGNCDDPPPESAQTAASDG